ncbi:hypothetical protein RUND412_005372 [Rhizina undulata]
MEGLPAEVLQEVVSYLSDAELDSMRLASRYLSSVANVFKFRTLQVRITREGLDLLMQISGKPELARCVHKITYPYRRLAPMQEPFMDPDHNINLAINVLHLNPSEAADTQNLALMFFQWYRNRYATQLELEESGNCAEALEIALSKMFNVRVICPGFNNPSIRDEYELWRHEILTEITSGIDVTWSRLWEYILQPRNVIEVEESISNAIIDLIDISNRLGLKPNRIDALGLNFNRVSSSEGLGNTLWRGILSDSNYKILGSCTSLFEKVTTLSISITTLDTNDDFEALKSDVKEGRLHRFLSSTPNLRALSLEVSLEAYIAGPEVLNALHVELTPSMSLLDILGWTCVWKHIRTFKLSLSPIRADELMHFLGCHAKTLQNVSIESPMLIEGTWRDVLDFMKERLHLTKLELETPYEMAPKEYIRGYNVNGQRRIQDYVLRDGAPFPPTLMELEKYGIEIKYLYGYHDENDGGMEPT